jgi:TonB family protein
MPRPAPPPRLVARLLLLVPLALGRAWASEGPAVDGVVAALEPARFAAPAYPPNARAERVSGTVVVRVTVDPGGVVVAAAVARSVRPDLDAAALAAAQAARFPSGAEGRMDATYVHAYVFTLTTTEASGEGVPGSVHLRLRDEAGAELRGVPARFTPADGGPERVFTSDEAGRVVALAAQLEIPFRPVVANIEPAEFERAV